MSITKIVVHCAYTPASMDIGADEIRRWHVQDNGWRDIGYHYVIRRDGTLETGRPENEQGAHVRGHNKGSLGICLVGGKPGANFTRQQWAALEKLVNGLTVKYPQALVMGHNNLDSGKTCPTFDAVAWWYGR
jgi:N-acetylmuramoyl-L-alanine amidase